MSATTHASPRARRARRPRLSLPSAPRRLGAAEDPLRQQDPATPKRITSLPFLALVAVLLGAGLLTLLMVNNTLAAGSFDQARLRAEQVQLFEQEQALRQDVERLSSPTRLRVEAHSLGLIPAATTAYLDVQARRILGTPLPAGGAAGAGAGEVPATPGSDPNAAPVPGADPNAAPVPDAAASDPAASDPAAPDPATTMPSQAPAEPGDGASVGGGTAYDRAIVSGASQ